MKILMVLSRIPWPLDKGDRLRAYHQIKYLSTHADIYLHCIHSEEIGFDIKEHLLRYCKEVYVHKLPLKNSYLNCMKNVVNKIPFQAAYFFDEEIKRKIEKEAERIKPDVSFFQLLRTAHYAENIRGKKVLDYMDAFSSGYLRMAQKSTGLKSYFYKTESHRLKKDEEKVFSWFDKQIIISDQDKNQMPVSRKDEIKVVTNGVDTSYFKPKQDNSKKYDLLFHGNMNYLPNVDAVEYVAFKILPQLKSSEFLISGSSPHPKVKRLSNNPKITITGWLNDVRTAYATGRVFVAPLKLGSGMQNKLLEAMAMGVPCVTSSLAANAIQAEHYKNIMICNNEKEYVDVINELLNNPELSEYISKNALEMIQKKYQWDLVNKNLLEVLTSD